jgi:hypothetical protein
MNVKITDDGFLRIEPETETESYALRCWCEKYYNKV